jgi:hypothetical protein
MQDGIDNWGLAEKLNTYILCFCIAFKLKKPGVKIDQL